MKVFVFLGPSLSKTEAEPLIDATFLPPVAMGDLYALVKTRARKGDLVGIVDGVFEQVPAIWHKEILYAIDRGVRVFGASSMGALRAAELQAFGMTGVGRIFAAYRDGEIEEDGDVVVAHGPAEHGYRAVSEALVNVRDALQRGLAEQIIDAGTSATLLQAATAQHYSDRSWASIGQAAIDAGADAAAVAGLRAYLQRTRPNLKRDDAIALMHRLESERLSAAEPDPPPPFVFEHTSFWIGLTMQREGPDGDEPAAALIAQHVRAACPDRASLLAQAWILHAVAAIGDPSDVSPEDALASTERFCRRHGLSSASALEAWCRRQQLSREDFGYLVALDARIRQLQQRERRSHDRHLLLGLKWTGRYESLADTVRRKWSALEAAGVERPVLEDAGLSAEQLQAWYEARTGSPIDHVSRHLDEIGFGSLRDFLSELLALYLLERDEVADGKAVGA